MSLLKVILPIILVDMKNLNVILISLFSTPKMFLLSFFVRDEILCNGQSEVLLKGTNIVNVFP